jgi:hypothetical protein
MFVFMHNNLRISKIKFSILIDIMRGERTNLTQPIDNSEGFIPARDNS